MRSKQTKRRKLAQLRASLVNQPLAMHGRVIGELMQAVELGDVSAVESALHFGGGDIPTTTKIVNGIAVIPVVGALRDEADLWMRWFGASCYQVIERDFQAAIDNNQVEGVLFYINSPGGQAVGCKRISDQVFASRGKKPIVAFVQGICASAAYYVASACDRVLSTADSVVGSIGTILTHSEISGLAKELGYKFTVITNAESPKKSHGNAYEPLSADAKATLQGYVDAYGKSFIDDVARNRGVTHANVVGKYGQGDAFVATEAAKRGMVDGIVASFDAAMSSMSDAPASVIESSDETDSESEDTPDSPSDPPEERRRAMPAQSLPSHSNIFSVRSLEVKRIKAQLFAMGLLDSVEASDDLANAAVRGFCKAQGRDIPQTEAEILAVLQGSAVTPKAEAAPAPNVKAAHEQEFAEARKSGEASAKAQFADLKAAAELLNAGRSQPIVTAEMVAEAFDKGLDCKAAIKEWNEKSLANAEPPVPTSRIAPVAHNADKFADDAVSALCWRANGGKSHEPLKDGAANLAHRPLWAIAGECLTLAGEKVDMYGDRELIARRAMEMGGMTRHTFFSEREGRQYVSADSSGIPYSRPGDFPHILSSLANKYLDTIELDDDYSFPKWTAVMPGGLNDFRPTSMVNKGIAEELDVVKDSEQFKEVGITEEILSYIFLQRFGNKFGWTPVMIANDNLMAFAEGMLGLEEAWMVTQNRLCLDILTGNPTLLDSSALFRTANDVTSGASPSDAQWAAMETKFADITGIGTNRRVRGTLNTILVPTGTAKQDAVRTFAPLNLLEPKAAATTANIGIYRGDVEIIAEGELRGSSTTKFYGFRSPRDIRTATVMRGYFNGFGTAGRRERWYDPESKTTWVSIEGRVGVAVKNWRYAVRNAGA